MTGIAEPDLAEQLRSTLKYSSNQPEINDVVGKCAAALTAAKAMADAVESAIGPYPATVYPNLRNALSAFRAAGG